MEFIKSTLKYVFNPIPGRGFDYYIYFYILAGLLILGGIIFKIYYEKNRKKNLALKATFRNLSKRAVTLGILFAFLMLARSEEIPYFSMRFLLGVLILISLYFIYHYVKVYKKDYKVAQLKLTKSNQNAVKHEKAKKYSTHKKRK